MTHAQKPYSRFLLIWAGQLLSKIGSGISAFALGIYLFQQTESTSAYAFLLLAAFLPSVLLAPIGGVIADRKDRKLLIVIGDLGSALGILFVIVMLMHYPGLHWPVYLGVAISSLFIALHSPAFKAYITDLLDEEAYAKASGLIQLAEASRFILAPVFAGLLLARLSLPLVLFIDVATFIVAALALVFIRNTTQQPHIQANSHGFWCDLAAGVRYIAGHRLISNLLVLTTLVTFFTGVLQSLFAPIILAFADVTTLGAIQSIAASGMVVSSLVIGLISKTHDQQQVLTRALLIAGLFYLLIGTTTNTVLLTGVSFCFFLTLPFVNTSLEVLFRQKIDNAMQGRIWALISLISQVGLLVAFGSTGLLVDHIFNPLLNANGPLANTIGRLIGTGPSRGSALLVIIAGTLFMATIAFYGKRQLQGEVEAPEPEV